MRWTMLLFMTIITNGLFAAEEPVRYLSIESGLSNNAVLNVYQDYKGFMWFGTYDGLNRYDGYRFRIYKNKIGDTTSLIDNAIYTIEGDSDHRLWTGGRRGICIFNPANEHFTVARYAKNGAPVQGTIHIIKAGDNGVVLAGSENNGLLRFDRHAALCRQVPVNGSTNYEVTAITFNRTKNIAYFFVQETGLCSYDCRTGAVNIISRELKSANCLEYDRDSMLWVGTDQGLFRYNGIYSTNYLHENSKIVDVCVDGEGITWAASDGGGVFLVSNGRIIPRKYDLSSNAVYSIYEDREKT